MRESWDEQAEDWIRWARTPGHDDFFWELVLPNLLELLPRPGRLTVDLGCGEGRLARDLTARGHRVVGVDASPTLIAAAREASPELVFHVADAARLPMRDAVADLVVAFMSLQDIDDLEGALAEAARVLSAGGRLCLAIVHPLNSAGTFEGDGADSPFVIRGSYLGSRTYQDTVERDGLRMVFASAHRPLSAYGAALERSGFFIELIREPAIPDSAVADARSRRWQRVPLFLHLRARRGAGDPRVS